MRLFDRVLIKEMALGGSMAFAALAAIFAVVLMVRVLARAAVGDLAEDAVFPMLGFGFLRFLPFLFSLSLFIGVFISLNRLWRDSEAVIWMNAGVGPLDWIRPVLLFSLPVVLVIAFVSAVLIPWSISKQTRFEEILASRDQVSTLAPGVFNEDRQGSRVFFVETISENNARVGNVFVQSSQQGRMGVIVAREGRVRQEKNGDRFLVLENGHRYEGTPGAADFRVGNFNSYAVRIQPQAISEFRDKPRMRKLSTLVQDPSPVNLGELARRVGIPLSALLSCLLAIPLSYVNPRAGRSLNVVFAILIYATYSNFVGLSQDWIERSVLSFGQSLGLVHGTMAVLLALAFRHRFREPARS